ncbi:hypothetical protein CPB86DRAFT_684780, partial [Serendipita vermifera]
NITKLLEQLSGSAAWQQAVAASSLNINQPSSTAKTPEIPPEKINQEKKPGASSESLQESASEQQVETSNRVSALLKLLDHNTIPNGSEEGNSPPEPKGKGVFTATTEETAPSDLRTVSFAEALSQITKLAQNPVILKHLIEIRDEQHRLEQKYWENRRQIIKKQESEIKQLKTKVHITGPLGPREAERLRNSFQKEIADFEKDEFLPAWEILLGRQQATLERIGIPLMYETNDVEARRQQQQIMNVLEG